MKVSELTLQTLKNFASINPNFVAKGGTNISTIAEAKNIVANANIDIELPEEFSIYDLNEFLSVLSLVDEPHMTFQDKCVVVSDSAGRSSITYYYSDPDMLTKSEKELIMPEAEIKFDLDGNTLSRVKRASSALGHDNVRITNNNGAITLTVMDKENSTSNNFSIDVPGEASIEGFEVYLNIANLKVLPGDYSVEISSKFISRFTKSETGHEYFVAVEKTSSF
jgi:hypothetical protein